MTRGSETLRFAILTVSDTCYEHKADDGSGNALQKFIETNSAGIVTKRQCVPDEITKIQNVLVHWSDSNYLDVILTTGGTGFSPRDVTPEATKAILDKEAPGIVIAITVKSLEVTKMAMLSRLACGIRKNTVILNLPGSTKGSVESLSFVIAQLGHAVDLVRNRVPSVKATHEQIQSGSCRHHHSTRSVVDPYNVAGRARKSEFTPMDVTLAQNIILEHSKFVQQEPLPISKALGYILSEDVYAKDPLPPFRASVKDGYAVKVHPDMKSSLLSVIGDATAGDKPENTVLASDNCFRISTGAPLPKGADAVVQVESTELVEKSEGGRDEKTIRMLVQPVLGQDIREVGSDIPMNKLVLQKGIRLGPAELGVLAAVGASKVKVFKKPIIALLSTGNELEEADQDQLSPGKIRDSNKTTLKGIFAEEGYEILDVGIARDTPDEVYKKLVEAMNVADIVVSTGGVSMGERDFLKQVLVQDIGAEIHFGSVLMKPGKPTKFATCSYNDLQKLIFGLPGNPVSAAVTALLFVIPACRKLSGWITPIPFKVMAGVAETLPLDVTRPEYHRGHLSWSAENPIPTVYSTGNQASSRLASCVAANALICLPQGTVELKEVKAGTLVPCILLSHF